MNNADRAVPSADWVGLAAVDVGQVPTPVPAGGVRRTPPVEGVSRRSSRTVDHVALAIAALVAAALVAMLVHGIYRVLYGAPERAVMFVLAAGAFIACAPVAAFLLYARRRASAALAGLLLLLGIVVVLTGIYFYVAAAYAAFPADLLIWSESDFVNDILKLHIGYPVYTAQQNNESFTYMPGAQAATFVLARLFGAGLSVTAFRASQVAFTVAAAGLSVLCARRLLLVSGHRRPLQHAIWTPLLLLVFVLLASNSLTNPFVAELHNDALAQLISIACYGALLEWAATRRRRWLIAMTLLAAIGFAVKQSLAAWIVLYLFYFAVFDRPFNIKHLIWIALAGFGAIGIVAAAGYVAWGAPFIYWVFTVLGSRSVSPLRAVQHALVIWPYLAAGLIGGAVLMGRRPSRSLLGLWLVWLAFIGLETYTSAIAWMLNHIGPGSLIAGIWFLAAVARIWPRLEMRTTRPEPIDRWWRVGVQVGTLTLALSGLAVIRIPVPPLPDDAYRYVSDIEREFTGIAPKDVLLDMGSWIYLRSGVVMQDRAPSIGERGTSQTGDFSGFIARLRARRYSKILVHHLHSPDFWYDHSSWRTSSGLRQALLENYHEIRTIPAVTGWIGRDTSTQTPYGLGDISVLIPNDRPQNTAVVRFQ